MKRITFVQCIKKLAACLTGGGPGNKEQPPVALTELAAYIAGLPVNDAGSPHTVRLVPVNISRRGVMGAINTAVTDRYIIVDLSACKAAKNAISSSKWPYDPRLHIMDVIKDNRYIVGIILPDRLTSIGRHAFSECSSLASITIPGSVTSIEGGAFSGCGNLLFTVTGTGSYRTLENGKLLVKNIGDTGNELVTYPSASGAVTLPSSITSIGDHAFDGCSSLTSITIPAGVTSIGCDTFYGCISLASVTIPESVTSIEIGAFFKCSSLTGVTIPAGITSIEGWAFSRCSSLTSITIPEGVTAIKEHAFSRCSRLASITIPEGVTSIGDCAFYDCSSLASVTIPSSVISIGNFAFSDCSSLTSITIPAGVTFINAHAFSGCSSLVSVTFAAGCNMNKINFSGSYPFPGDLYGKYFSKGGGAGTYTAARQPDDDLSVGWTKQ